MENLIKRGILPGIRTHLKEKEITFLVGPRRAGKTTLLQILLDELAQTNAITRYFNLDRESDLRTFDSQERIIFLINQDSKRIPEGGRVYVFIDEIQRRENAGIFLKGIYDYIDFQRLPVKLIVTGSGAIELKEKVKESLAGRKLLFEVKTLSFYEFIQHKNTVESDKDIEEFARLFPEKLYDQFTEYLNYGGYPEVVVEQDYELKAARLQELYDAYIEKDIKQLLHIEKSRDFSQLVRILASQTGNLVNKAELSRTVGVAQNTIDAYLWYLEKTFILTLVPPFYKNPRKEITRMPVVYFNDLGMRSFASSRFDIHPAASTEGYVFENFIFRLMADTLPKTQPLHFWRTNTGAEVDFLVGSYTNPIPVEVKMSRFQGNVKYGKSFYSFLNKYKPEQGYVYNLDTHKEETIGSTRVKSLRYYDMLKLP